MLTRDLIHFSGLDITDWLQGVGTFLAAGFALLALRSANSSADSAAQAATYTADQLAIEQARDAGRAAVAKRAQADRVSAWLGPMYAQSTATSRPTTTPLTGSWQTTVTERTSTVQRYLGTGFYVRNMSELPVFDVDVYIETAQQSEVIASFSVLGPESTRSSNNPLDPALAEQVKRSRQAGYTSGAAVSFRDAAGTFWTRRADGELVEGRQAWSD